MSTALPPRSWLFVPGDSERKLAKALGCPADALILDLEDSVAVAQLPAARKRVANALNARSADSAQQIWVRINPPSSAHLRDDLAAILPGKPDGLVLPKISAPRDIAKVTQHTSIKLLVIATETPQAVLTLPQWDLAGLENRLAGLTWGTEDLGAALGATGKTQMDGSLTFTFELARSLCLLVAAYAGVQAVDSIHADFRDATGLAREAARARRDGFTGKLAIHPDQVATINAAFSPTEAEIVHARKIVAAFAAQPDVGVTSVDGRMLDRPHLLQAQRLLRLAQRSLDAA
jgi:citrate lyase subunit beta / citryl-CoA lyase